MFHFLFRFYFHNNQKGQASVGYTLMVAVVAVGMASALRSQELQNSIGEFYTDAATRVISSGRVGAGQMAQAKDELWGAKPLSSENEKMQAEGDSDGTGDSLGSDGEEGSAESVGAEAGQEAGGSGSGGSPQEGMNGSGQDYTLKDETNPLSKAESNQSLSEEGSESGECEVEPTA